MTLRIEPLEPCMNVFNGFSLKCFVLSIYIRIYIYEYILLLYLCCRFSILSRGMAIVKIFCVHCRPELANGLMSDRYNINVAVILWLLM